MNLQRYLLNFIFYLLNIIPYTCFAATIGYIGKRTRYPSFTTNKCRCPPANRCRCPSKAQSFNRCWGTAKTTKVHADPYICPNVIGHHTSRANHRWSHRGYPIGKLSRSPTRHTPGCFLQSSTGNCLETGKPINLADLQYSYLSLTDLLFFSSGTRLPKQPILLCYWRLWRWWRGNKFFPSTRNNIGRN